MGAIFERMPHHLVVGSFHDNLSCAKGKIPKADEIFLMARGIAASAFTVVYGLMNEPFCHVPTHSILGCESTIVRAYLARMGLYH
jgi:hypothetical protein